MCSIRDLCGIVRAEKKQTAYEIATDKWESGKVASPVEKARLYITACGLYEARIGGRKAGDFYMARRPRSWRSSR